jgi:UDP-N-acetylmuramate--alanine ligase
MVHTFDAVQQAFTLDRTTPVHFVGIGGIGMSGLARLLLGAGFTVTGSDANKNDQTQWLQTNGATVYLGHAAQNVPENAVVVTSTAIMPTNPEYQVAQQRGQVIIHRSACLREILQGATLGHKVVVGLSGTHGKTTMTGLMGQVLLTAGLDPTIIAGGILPTMGANARWGQSHHIAVAELDESDGSILEYRPTHLVIANLELDHAEHYPGGFADIVRTFEQVLARMPVGGHVIYNADCPATAQLVKEAGQHLKTVSVSLKDPSANVYGHQPQAEAGQGFTTRIFIDGQPVGTVLTVVPGLYNVHNALLVVATAQKIGVPFEAIAEGIKTFPGMGRRFERIAEPNGVLLVDDYGHHPTEVQVTLTAAKALATDRGGELVVVFQPHRYSRLHALWHDFTQAFELADNVVITDVYAAGEAPMPGIDGQTLSQKVGGQFVPKAEWATLRQQLLGKATAGDVLLSMGAGDITQLWRH